MKACRIQLEILQERLRQQEREGFSDDHDDTHVKGELAAAGAAYAQCAMVQARDKQTPIESDLWPWLPDEFNPKDPRRNLIRAAALMVAEIERLDRATEKAAQQPH